MGMVDLMVDAMVHAMGDPLVNQQWQLMFVNDGYMRLSYPLVVWNLAMEIPPFVADVSGFP